MDAELKMLVVRLNAARKMADAFRDDLDAKRQAWMAANQDLFNAVNEAAKQVTELEAALRVRAVAAYNADPQKNKDLGCGVGIRVMTRLEYDAKTALGWAQKTGLALKLDTPAFEKIAKASNLDFVRSREEPSATISPNLEAALKEGA